MASNQEPIATSPVPAPAPTTLPLKLLVDTKAQRVVAAEASKDFVDILFSFLTLPMGTIIRIISHHPAKIGCISNLYQSVENLDANSLWTDHCKEVLLSPRNPHESQCMNLKLNVDDSSNCSCFVCPRPNCRRRVSHYINVQCSCGKALDREVNLQKSEEIMQTQGVDNMDIDGNGGAFLKEGTMFIITDDLQIICCSPSNLLKMLLDLGTGDMDQLNEISVELGLKEISSLLKYALVSKSPLTDLFLSTEEQSTTPLTTLQFNSRSSNNAVRATNGSTINLSLKIMLKKSTNEILYAEARDDFVDFLFSFLTIPLGSVVKLLDGNTALGCIDKLYKSVESLDSEWFIRDGESRFMLLNAGVAPHYSCKNQPLNIHKALVDTGNLILVDPRHPSGKADGFVKKPTAFVVSDDLVVMPLASTSSVSLLKKLSTPIADIEEQVISIGESEALSLLRATLVSTSALSIGLNSVISTKLKQELED